MYQATKNNIEMKKIIIYFTLLLSFGLIASSCVETAQKNSEPIAENKVAVELEYKDFGNAPFVFNIEDYTVQNETYRTVLWSGEFIQLTVMNILPGEDIGLELHTDHDQFIRVEQGEGVVKMGDAEDDLSFEAIAKDDFAIMIPAGKWHNVVNNSDKPLKLYSLYAPAEHAKGTVHKTREEALEEEH